MSKKMLLIFSHKLTDNQKSDAQESLGVSEFLSLPEDLQKKWSQIPADLDKNELEKYLEPIKKWIFKNGKKNDLSLVSGDFGATYQIINFCKENSVKPYHSTNKRVAKEIFDGDKVHVSHTFQHVKFREF
ncbi:hypothetical protein ThvES_00015670 [Thiovulum sp. ES]|nr:hypothetical protein ThvES_00015670 [Thiovulum sp. ES]